MFPLFSKIANNCVPFKQFNFFVILLLYPKIY